MEVSNQGHQQKGCRNAPGSIQAQRPSLAWSDPPETPTSRVQAKPKMVWPLQDTECDIPCSVQTGPPCFMNNPPSLPCIPSYPICWNKHPWSKLLPTPTWPDWWWRTIQGGTDWKLSTSWTFQNAPISHKVVGLPWKWQHLGTSWPDAHPGSPSGVSQTLALGKHKREAETPGKSNNPQHHTVQITHHSFSMASSPSPLPVQLPSHLKHESVIITDQLVNTASCSNPVPSNQIAIPGPLHDLEANAFWDRPLSPFTVQNILAGHENLSPIQLQSLIAGLATTLQQREEIYNSKAHHFRQHLADVNAECHALKQHIQDIDSKPLLCPDGFEDNNGRLPTFTVPGPDGESLAIFIKQLDDGRVAGLSSRARGEHDACIVDLFTTPSLNNWPLKPLPHWFHTCLWGNHTNFHLLQEAIIALNDWGILTEVKQYQVLDQEVATLQAESCLVDANLAASQLAKEACKDHLVAAQVAEKVKPVGVKHFKLQIAWWLGWRKSMGCGCPN